MVDTEGEQPKQLSDRATAEWLPDADPPVYVVRTFDDEIDHKTEIHLEPQEVDRLVRYHQAVGASRLPAARHTPPREMGKQELSNRVTVEWVLDADPPGYVVRTHDNESGSETEIYLEPEEVSELATYHDGILDTSYWAAHRAFKIPASERPTNPTPLQISILAFIGMLVFGAGGLLAAHYGHTAPMIVLAILMILSGFVGVLDIEIAQKIRWKIEERGDY